MVAVTATDAAFTQGVTPPPHRERAQQILAAHPDVRGLFERDRWSALWTVLLVALQVAIGIGLVVLDAPWWAIIIVAYAFGAFANHALFVLIHDYTHNRVFKTANANKLGSIFANIAIVFPAAIGFRNHHLLHHKYLGIPGLDADVPTPNEARWVGNSWWRKTFWLSMFWAVQGFLRPTTVKAIRTVDNWVVFNAVAMAAAMAPIVWFFGWWPVAYLFISSLLSLGVHPVGARSIQEHYVFRGKSSLFLLRSTEQAVVQYGLPQRAPRLPPGAVVAPPGGARRGAGVLRSPLSPPVVDQAAVPRHLQPQVPAAQPHRATDARGHEGRGRSLTLQATWTCGWCMIRGLKVSGAPLCDEQLACSAAIKVRQTLTRIVAECQRALMSAMGRKETLAAFFDPFTVNCGYRDDVCAPVAQLDRARAF